MVGWYKKMVNVGLKNSHPGNSNFGESGLKKNISMDVLLTWRNGKSLV
jgi:hypothetical protein